MLRIVEMMSPPITARIGSPLPPTERSRHEQRVIAARAAIRDDEIFDRAWQEGCGLSPTQATELASEEVE